MEQEPLLHLPLPLPFWNAGNTSPVQTSPIESPLSQLYRNGASGFFQPVEPDDMRVQSPLGPAFRAFSGPPSPLSSPLRTDGPSPTRMINGWPEDRNGSTSPLRVLPGSRQLSPLRGANPASAQELEAIFKDGPVLSSFTTVFPELSKPQSPIGGLQSIVFGENGGDVMAAMAQKHLRNGSASRYITARKRSRPRPESDFNYPEDDEDNAEEQNDSARGGAQPGTVQIANGAANGALKNGALDCSNMMGSLMEHKEMLGGVPRWKQVSAVQALNLQQLNGQSNGISSPTLSSPTGSSLTIAQLQQVFKQHSNILLQSNTTNNAGAPHPSSQPPQHMQPSSSQQPAAPSTQGFQPLTSALKQQQQQSGLGFQQQQQLQQQQREFALGPLGSGPSSPLSPLSFAQQNGPAPPSLAHQSERDRMLAQMEQYQAQRSASVSATLQQQMQGGQYGSAAFQGQQAQQQGAADRFHNGPRSSHMDLEDKRGHPPGGLNGLSNMHNVPSNGQRQGAQGGPQQPQQPQLSLQQMLQQQHVALSNGPHVPQGGGPHGPQGGLKGSAEQQLALQQQQQLERLSSSLHSTLHHHPQHHPNSLPPQQQQQQQQQPLPAPARAASATGSNPPSPKGRVARAASGSSVPPSPQRKPSAPSRRPSRASKTPSAPLSPSVDMMTCCVQLQAEAGQPAAAVTKALEALAAKLKADKACEEGRPVKRLKSDEGGEEEDGAEDAEEPEDKLTGQSPIERHKLLAWRPPCNPKINMDIFKSKDSVSHSVNVKGAKSWEEFEAAVNQLIEVTEATSPGTKICKAQERVALTKSSFHIGHAIDLSQLVVPEDFAEVCLRKRRGSAANAETARCAKTNGGLVLKLKRWNAKVMLHGNGRGDMWWPTSDVGKMTEAYHELCGHFREQNMIPADSPYHTNDEVISRAPSGETVPKVQPLVPQFSRPPSHPQSQMGGMGQQNWHMGMSVQ